jgi:putative FmdB family regulatory protein
MPIYAYKCSACGFAKDTLQKMSDAPLTTCPECGQETFTKQVTAAGFQLKGSGWYVTDFRNNGSSAGKPAPKLEAGEGASAPAASNGDGAGEKSSTEAAPAKSESAAPAASSEAKPAAAPKPAASTSSPPASA